MKSAKRSTIDLPVGNSGVMCFFAAAGSSPLARFNFHLLTCHSNTGEKFAATLTI